MDKVTAARVALNHQFEDKYKTLDSQIKELVQTASFDDFLACGAREIADIQYGSLEERYEKKLAEIVLDSDAGVNDDLVDTVKDRIYFMQEELNPARKHASTPLTPLFYGMWIICLSAFFGLKFLPKEALSPIVVFFLALVILMMPLWVVGNVFGRFIIRRMFKVRLDAVLNSIDDLAVITSRSSSQSPSTAQD